MRVLVPFIALAALVTGACAADDPSPAEVAVEVLAEGLAGPTQIAHDGRGGYVVAELNGGEREGAGRVLRFGSLDAEPEVLVDGLLTPTGVAVDGDLLWVMERRRLTVGPLDGTADREVVLDELPFNGRSEGTISPVAGGGILYDTSGATRDGELVDGSGTLWFLSGPDAEPEAFATGFKHAYAHTPAGDDRWFVTEISDGTFDGSAPPDDVVVAAAGDDFAFPACIGDNQPVAELGATDADCAEAPGSHAVLPPRSTPTGVAIAPWDPDLVLVALWTEGRIVAVPASAEGRPHVPVTVADDVGTPQHLLADGDRVLVTDHAGGRVVAIAPGD